ncbi:hypothetical protein P12x_005037 [Tundrisphaera lichenicola]|uniref:hypothetical protein n=1 Tax=Tundrisphaera lichenicola TaxID=2029860 RepID=UPI003EB9B80D
MARLVDLAMKYGPTILLIGLVAGCGDAKPARPTSAHAPAPLSIQRPEGGMRVFSASDDFATNFGFEGARGSVRVTMEIQRVDASKEQGGPTINDVLFRAEGDGRISIIFHKPKPGQHDGRVTIRCESGGEESEAEFEPDLWMEHPTAIVTFDPPPTEPADTIAEDREIVLARYIARNMPQDIRLTLKAVFSKASVPPRVKAKAKAKPPR